VQKRLENGSFDGSRCVLYNAFVLASYWLECSHNLLLFIK
jgi:hypothetical protein